MRVRIAFALLASSLVALAPARSSAATPPETPVAIVYGLSGHATSGQSPPKPLSVFDWLPASTSLEVGPASTVSIAFANGTRYELGPGAKVRVEADDLGTRSGPVRRLPSVPRIPILAPIVDKASLASSSGAVRVRGAAALALYPARGARSLADATVLHFGAVPGASRYAIRITDAGGRVAFEKETTDTRVVLPAGLLRAGAQYAWSLRAITADGTVQAANSQISTLDQQSASARAALAASLRRSGDPASLALLAGVDERLGLLWEARDELRLADRQDTRFRDTLERLEQELKDSSPK
jgi:hypothetical protein